MQRTDHQRQAYMEFVRSRLIENPHGTKAVMVVSGAADDPVAAASDAAEVVVAVSVPVLAAVSVPVLAAVSVAVLDAVSATVLEAAAVESCRLTGEAEASARTDKSPNAGPNFTIFSF